MSSHTIYGMEIVISNNLGLVTVSNKKHIRKSWMSGFYHYRIQKKWDKKHGTHESEQIIRFGNKIAMSPMAFNQLQRDMYHE